MQLFFCDANAQAHDTNTTALGVAASARGNHSTALGKQARTFGKEATAVGHWADSRAEFSTAFGAHSIAYKKGALAVGTMARAYDENSIALGSNSIAKEAMDGKAYLSGEDVKAASGIVSVGNPDYKVGDTKVAANYRRIVNVAGGIRDNDAVNVAQLKSLETMMKQAADEQGKALNNLQGESREGDAMNAALAALKPLDFDPYNRSHVMAGVSTYRGKQALALGLAHYSNEDTLVHAGVSYGGHSELMANAGISWRFGDKDDRDARAKRAERLPQYADGPISSVYVMQDEMAALRAENQSLREKNQEIKRQVEMLMKHAGLKA